MSIASVLETLRKEYRPTLVEEAERLGASIAAKDWPIIQHKEGAITGMCVERTVTVRVGEQTVEATAFTTNPQRARQDGPVSSEFVEALIRGAAAASLPGEYLSRLRSLR